ncbi:MAG: methyltransferase [Alphaproteobacteria bacterium]|nr:methyltransferase [Alphaproteobacteria bacterium]
MSEKQEVFTIMGGHVKILRGPYNPTSDAVWVAAFADGHPKTVLDVGTGTGAVALCLMARIPDIQMTAIDISQQMLDAAKENFTLNNQNAEFINADIMTWRTDKTFDLVITNPPYFKGTPASHNAHHNADLVKWVRQCIARVKPGGAFTTIVNMAETATIVSEMTQHHCGDIQILPLFSTRSWNSAERVLISGRLGRAPHCNLFSGLPMNCDEILRNGMSVKDVWAMLSSKKR